MDLVRNPRMNRFLCCIAHSTSASCLKPVVLQRRSTGSVCSFEETSIDSCPVEKDAICICDSPNDCLLGQPKVPIPPGFFRNNSNASVRCQIQVDLVGDIAKTPRTQSLRIKEWSPSSRTGIKCRNIARLDHFISTVKGP
jgi:hypothetical protein